MLMYHLPSRLDLFFLGLFFLIVWAFYLRRLSRIRHALLASLELDPIKKSELIRRLDARRLSLSKREFLKITSHLEKRENTIIVSMDVGSGEMTYALHPHHSYVAMRILKGEIRTH